MRHLPTARGQHHLCTSNTRRAWFFHESSGVPRQMLNNGTTDLSNTGTPTVNTDGWLGPTYRSFDGSTNGLTGGGAGGEATQLTANAWTIGLVWRRRASAAGTIFCYGGNSGTTANNVLARLKMASDGGLTFEWEDGTPTLRSVAIPTYKLPLNRWTYIHVVRTGATTVRIYINGRLIATLAMTSANSGGSTSIWNIGQDEGLANKIAGDLNSFFLETVAMSATEIYTDCRRASLQAFETSVRARVKIKDGNDAYRDMTALEGQDFVESFSIREDADSPCEVLNVTLTREIELLSLAPLVTSSKLNLTNVDNLASYEELVGIQREILVEMARVPLGHAADSTDWQQRFHGHIDEVDVAGETVEVVARDDGGRLVDDFLQTDLQMPITSGGACAADPTTGERRASVEEAIQDLLNQHTGASAPTLYAPTAANLCLIPWDQKKDSIMAAARACAAVKAWDFGYTFDESPGQNTLRPTLIDPGRDRVDADGVIMRNDYASITRAAIDVYQVRNRVYVTFGNKNNRDPEGNKIALSPVVGTSYVPAEDSTSKTKYGGIWRTIFITEGSTSPIDEQSEAETMQNGVLSDLKDPMILVECPDVNCFFEAELNDIHTFVGDNVHWTGDQTLAVSAVRLEYGEGAGSVTLGLRGKPTAGAKRWLSMDARPGMNPPNWTTTNNANFGLNLLDRARISDALLTRTTWNTPPFADLVKNSDFSRVSRGSGYMPDGWKRADSITTGTGWISSQTLHDTLPTGNGAITVVATDRRGGRALCFSQTGTVGPWPIISDFTPIEGSRVYSIAVRLAYAGSNNLNPGFAIAWYDASKAFLSSSSVTPAVPSAYFDQRTISLVDDSGAGNAIQVTTTAAHGLAVGDYMTIDGTTNYQTPAGTMDEVAAVVSATQVTLVRTTGGGVASEATGRVGLFRTKRSTESGVVVTAPVKARFARAVVIRTAGPGNIDADVFLDWLTLYRVADEFYAYRSSDLTITATDAWEQLIFNAERFDYGSNFDISGAGATNGCFVVPEDGVYDFISQAAIACSVSGGTTQFGVGLARILRNGTEVARSPNSPYVENTLGTSASSRTQVKWSDYCLKGDVIKVEGKIAQITGTTGLTRRFDGGAGADESWFRGKLRVAE